MLLPMLLKNPTCRRPSLRTLALASCLFVPGAALRAETLAELLAGASIDAGNARFSHWQLTGLDASGAAPNLAFVNVTPVIDNATSYGLQFASLVQLSVSGLNSLDLSFSYRVQAIGSSNSFAGHAIRMNGLAMAGGFAHVAQDALELGGAALGAAVAFASARDNVFHLIASADHAAHLTLAVNTNVFLQGIDATDSIGLTAFTQTFSQTGPTTIAGDFNNDKRADGGDFLVWQRGGSPTPLSATDLAAWRTNFGQNINAAPAMAAVPEPAAGALAALGAFALLDARRRKDD